jgi:hypothetical protein
MNLASLAKKAERIVTENSPVILTALGVTGLVATAYLTGKAAFRSAEILRDEEDNRADLARVNDDVAVKLTGREKFDMLYKLYLPAVGTGVLSAACIVGSNRIGTRRAAALASAVNLSERAFSEYREKIVDKIGEKPEREARQELAQEKFHNTLHSGASVVVTGETEQLCFDLYSNTPFMSSMTALQKAENEIFNMIRAAEHATLSDFYDLIGLPPTSTSAMVGWNHDNPCKLVIDGMITPDDKPALSVDFEVRPVPSPERFRKFG